jgi:hypothetical protein
MQAKHGMEDVERVETAGTRARREEEWKEARKVQLESELAGDLEREWREIAEQRKLRTQVCEGLNCLPWAENTNLSCHAEFKTSQT